MASISGSIQMLRENQVKEGVNNRLMEIVLREINRLNHLVEDFLLFARPKKAEIKEVDMNKLILESQELFKNSRFWNDTIRIVNTMTDSVLLKSDPEQIKQILLNLFLNACDEMPDGGELHIKTCIEKIPDERNQGIERVKIVVRDTGNGFSEKALENLFIPFFTTKKEGSGLGLAIVKRIVEGLNGKISGKNYSEGGAEISVLLPVNPPAQFDLDKA
jgi:two-component system sensor histidine kinase PilS (NtrC family)